ncbi:hypothetical protein IKG05_00780 [Candidatus Saccharibacteria bacterium]|nr:hypothetical protein [Candidatus Saccharibacteria bacterium]
MDGQQYLNQISESNRPAPKAKGINGLLSSKFFLVGAIGIALLIVIIIFGSILSSGKGDEKSLSYSLLLHLNNTTAIVQDYQPYIKSSNLRSYSASLQGILSNTSSQLTAYLEEKYNFNIKDISDSLEEEATLAKDDLESDLFEAKINGVLDRTYAYKIAYEIALITTEETSLIKSTKDESLQNILSSSYESLTTLYDQFDNFSEGGKQ